MRAFAAQVARFGVVGGLGFVVDIAVFNVLRATILDPSVITSGPIIAKVISTVLAIIVNWIGNRYWTFRETRRTEIVREGVEFGLVSLGGLVVTLGCLWFSHYVLGFTSQLADNISGNVIGLGLGTLFRFVFYRAWVYHPSRTAVAPESLGAPESPVRPTRRAPRRRVEAVSSVDDGALGND
jgi:putative flippase GtrA